MADAQQADGSLDDTTVQPPQRMVVRTCLIRTILALFVVLLLLAVIVSVGLRRSWSEGTTNIPVYKTVEGVAERMHEKTGQWPNSIEEVFEVDPESRRIIEPAFKSLPTKTTFEPLNDRELRIVFQGTGDHRFTITRYVWKESDGYRAGPRD